MSNYTEADVETDVAGLEGTINNSGYVEEIQALDRKSLARLKAAALEGAKVPGLVADNAAMGSTLAHAESLCRLRIEDWALAPEEKQHFEELLDNIQPAAIAWRNGTVGHEFCEEVFALRKQVFDLQANLKDVESRLQSAGDGLTAAIEQVRMVTSERDALRAQMGQFEKSIATALGMISKGQHTLAEANLRLALSAPPVETETDDEAHRRLDALGVPRFGRCPATNKRESLTLDERRELAPPAETTPAPERAEAPKREAELIQTLRTERDGYRSQVQAARDAIAAQYNNADFVAVNFSVPHGANRTSYLIRDALAAVRDSMSCRHDCDRWHGGKHSWE